MGEVGDDQKTRISGNFATSSNIYNVYISASASNKVAMKRKKINIIYTKDLLNIKLETSSKFPPVTHLVQKRATGRQLAFIQETVIPPFLCK